LKPWISLGLGLVCLAALTSACGDDDDDGEGDQPAASTQDGNSEEAAQSSFPLTVTRSDGVELTLEAQAERIVSLDPSATEILYAIEAGDQVVASDLFSNFPEEAQAKARLDAYQPSPEAILAEGPDLVLMFVNNTGAVEILDDLGATVLYLEVPDSLEGIYERIELYGSITGHEDEATELVESMEGRVDAVVEAVSSIEEGPRIFHELDPTLFTVTSSSFIGELYELIKAENIADSAEGEFPQLTSEAVIAADPEVIILADEEFGESLETVHSRPGWDVISAVVEERVYGVNPDIASRPGPRIVEFLETVAAYLYPELFE
jgi:iron complex transport system substrate-binding protein